MRERILTIASASTTCEKIMRERILTIASASTTTGPDKSFVSCTFVFRILGCLHENDTN